MRKERNDNEVGDDSIKIIGWDEILIGDRCRVLMEKEKEEIVEEGWNEEKRREGLEKKMLDIDKWSEVEINEMELIEGLFMDWWRSLNGIVEVEVGDNKIWEWEWKGFRNEWEYIMWEEGDDEIVESNEKLGKWIIGNGCL